MTQEQLIQYVELSKLFAVEFKKFHDYANMISPDTYYLYLEEGSSILEYFTYTDSDHTIVKIESDKFLDPAQVIANLNKMSNVDQEDRIEQCLEKIQFHKTEIEFHKIGLESLERELNHLKSISVTNG